MCATQQSKGDQLVNQQEDMGATADVPFILVSTIRRSRDLKYFVTVSTKIFSSPKMYTNACRKHATPVKQKHPGGWQVWWEHGNIHSQDHFKNNLGSIYMYTHYWFLLHLKQEQRLGFDLPRVIDTGTLLWSSTTSTSHSNDQRSSIVLQHRSRRIIRNPRTDIAFFRSC